MTSPRSSPEPSPTTSSASPDERQALDVAFSAAYEELRRLAWSVARREASATLSPTALVNEAWLKLAGSPELARTSPLHFKRIAARAMRQVLVEAARKRLTEKRGGGEALVTFDESVDEAPRAGSTADDVVAIDDALAALARLSPRQAQVVEGRFFGGLDVAEIAASLEISEATVLRDWRAARAWLRRELRRSS